jgi:hypothetical protein
MRSQPRSTEFRSLFSANWEFSEKGRLTPMYFERKFDFFKTSKNTNMGPLGTTNPEYGTHNTEI